MMTFLIFVLLFSRGAEEATVPKRMIRGFLNHLITVFLIFLRITAVPKSLLTKGLRRLK